MSKAWCESCRNERTAVYRNYTWVCSKCGTAFGMVAQVRLNRERRNETTESEGDKEEVKGEEWECSECGVINNASRTICRGRKIKGKGRKKCGGERPW